MARQPEAKLVNDILVELRSHRLMERPGWWFKVHGSAMQTSGVPDIVGVYRGRFVAFEVKVPGKEDDLSARQKVILHRIRHSGGVPKVVSSAHDAMGLLRKLDKLVDYRETEYL